MQIKCFVVCPFLGGGPLLGESVKEDTPSLVQKLKHWRVQSTLRPGYKGEH